MKVGVFLIEKYNPKVGGGFSYYERLIGGIDMYNFADSLEICFVSFSEGMSLNKKEFYHIESFSDFAKNKIKLIDKIIFKIPKIGLYYKERKYRTFELLHQIFIREKLKELGIKLILLPIQQFLPVRDFPFISLNWDIAHLTAESFPETTYRNDSFRKRNEFYQNILPGALRIFVESESGKKELIDNLRISSKKVKVIPLFASDLKKHALENNTYTACLSKYNLIEKKFFFYPAQFWAHKNHYNLIRAFCLLSKNRPDFKLVFTGGDAGNLTYINKIIKDYLMEEKIINCGFIAKEEMAVFYSATAGLVMPTLIGPTNMPLLEALDFNCPILCSDIEGHREILEDAACYFNPLIPEEICEKMELVIDENIRSFYIAKGKIVLKNTKFNFFNSMNLLNQFILELEPICNCWE